MKLRRVAVSEKLKKGRSGSHHGRMESYKTPFEWKVFVSQTQEGMS